MKKIAVTAICIFLHSVSFGQTKELNIKFMLRGDIYAASTIKDTAAPGGYGESDNYPKPINSRSVFEENGLFLKIDTTKNVSFYGEYKGYKLYIGNKSDSIVELQASDSRLNVIAEVLYKGKWEPIVYLPSSWCGNSYHSVYLEPNEYWEFNIPKFSGKIKTKLRYKLILTKTRFIYSNEIAVHINKEQLTEKKDYEPNGLMDPYND